MEIQQFVLAYQAEQDRLRALLPAGVESLRPVLRINAELRGGPAGTVYLELNTPVAAFGKRGWWERGPVGRARAHPLTARQEGQPPPSRAPLPHPQPTPKPGRWEAARQRRTTTAASTPKRGSPALSRRRPSPPLGPSATWTSNGPLPPGMPRAAARTGRPCRPFPPRQRSSTPGSP